MFSVNKKEKKYIILFISILKFNKIYFFNIVKDNILAFTIHINSKIYIL